MPKIGKSDDVRDHGITMSTLVPTGIHRYKWIPIADIRPVAHQYPFILAERP